MSLEAMAWVFQHAPNLKPHWAMTLMGLANHADELGKGARPSQATLAWYCQKDERNIRRDLDAMEDAGLIRKGDQRMVAHLPPDKRPVVWDLAMELTRGPRPEPSAPGRKRAGADAPPNADGNRGGADARGDAEGKTGGALAPNRGGADALQAFLEPPQEKTSTPKEGRGEPDSASPSELTDEERALAGEVGRRRPSWSPVSTRHVLASPEIRERTDRALVRLAFLIAAEDRATRTPYRLVHDACPAWAAAERELYPQEAAHADELPRVGRVAWCGDPGCDSVTRTGVHPPSGRPLPGRPRCPACHPDSPAVQP